MAELEESKVPEQTSLQIFDEKLRASPNKSRLVNYYFANDELYKLKALMYVCKIENNECADNFINLRQVLNRFDILRANIQGVFLRDYNYRTHPRSVRGGKRNEIRDNSTIIIDLYKKMELNFLFETIHIGINQGTISGGTSVELGKKIQEIKRNSGNPAEELYYTFLQVHMSEYQDDRIVIHLIERTDDGEFGVYIYDPKKIAKPYEQAIKDIYIRNGFYIRDLPNKILVRTGLPLGYMYVMHFFLGHILYPQNHGEYNDEYDDHSIITFTRFMMKLVHEHGLYDDKFSYYLLTDNTKMISEMIGTMPNRDLTLQHLYFISSIEMLTVLFSHGFVFTRPVEPNHLLVSYSDIDNYKIRTKRNQIIMYALTHMAKKGELNREFVGQLRNDYEVRDIQNFINQRVQSAAAAAAVR